jgi:hypothetical protein
MVTQELQRSTIASSTIDAIRQAIAEAMAPVQIESLTVTPAKDDDGDDIIYVDVNLGFSETAISARSLIQMQVATRDHLWTLGEHRFPHVRPHFRDGQKFKLAS